MKWLVDTWASTRSRPRILKVRKFLLGVVVVARRHPRGRAEGRRRAGRLAPARRPRRSARACTVSLRRRRDPLRALGRRQRRARRGQRHRLGRRLRRARRHHLGAVPGAGVDPARARRRRAAHQPPERRLPRPHRGSSCRCSTTASTPSAWPSPAPSWPATSSPARAPTPATSPSPRAGASPRPSATALEEAGLADVGGVRINISGCTNSCGQHHIADIGFFGAERRAHGTQRPRLPDAARRLRRPGRRSTSARRRCACRPRRPRGRRRGSSAASPTSARPARRSAAGWTAPAAPRASPPRLEDLDEFPDPDEHPEFYVDYDETGPYEAVIGDSECAT